MKKETNAGQIVGRYEIAELLGVTRQGIATILDHPDFPPPICSIGKNGAPLFYRRAVETFAAERRAARSAEPAAA